MIDERLLGIFIEEARDLARRLLANAVKLESAPPSVDRSELMAEILRDLHTMKGSAGSVDSAATKHIASNVHHVEDRLKAAGPGAVADAELLDHLIDVLTEVQRDVEQVAAGNMSVTVPTPPSAPESPSAETAPPPTPDSEEGDSYSPVEGIHLFMGDEAASAEVPPAPVATPAAAPAAAPAPAARARSSDAESKHSEPLKIRPERIDAAHDVAGELVVSRLHTEALTADLIQLREVANSTAQLWRGLMGDLRQNRRVLGAAWVPIEQKVNGLQSRLTEIRQESTVLARRATSIRDRSSALIGTLDERIRSLRMMPVQPFLEELLPVAREAAKASGRRVRLVPDGGDAEVDRQVLVALREPLLHMVRNGVVHGIEPPDERERLGKPRTGNITLQARCEGPRIQIRVIDDGRGVNVDKVLEKGRAAGLVGADAGADPETILRLLLAPGMSTAAKVDGLAGRGVGMDVVSSSIQQLNGSLSLEWERGQGSTFTIDVPISTSTTAGLVVVVGSSRFGLPLSHIERVVRLTRDDLVSGENHPFVRLNGEPVAATALGPFVGQPFKGLGAEKVPAIVLQSKGVRLALLVDDIAGQREMWVKALPAAFAVNPMLVGGAVEADGSVLQVLDALALLQRVERDGVHNLELLDVPAKPRVLVVDSSRPMQSLLRGVLTAGGFTFDGAATVAEAKTHLANQPYALVVVDPRIPDAIALCAEVRALENPPSLVTMTFDVDAGKKSLDAGANAFIDKNSFTQGAFLDMAREQVGVS